MERLRKRHKEGWLELDKRGSPHRWVARWYTNESYVNAQGATKYRIGRQFLGFKTNKDLPTKASAQAKWDGIRDQLLRNHRPQVKNPDITFKQYCEQEYIPLRRSGWAKTTKTKMGYLFDHLFKAVGDLRLTDITARHLKGCLDGLAGGYSYDVVNGVYVLVRSVFKQGMPGRS